VLRGLSQVLDALWNLRLDDFPVAVFGLVVIALLWLAAIGYLHWTGGEK
jgi:hypothetical protein